MALRHLRVRLKVFVLAVEHVEDQKAVLYCHASSCEDGVEHGEIGLWGKAKDARGLTNGWERKGQRGHASEQAPTASAYWLSLGW